MRKVRPECHGYKDIRGTQKAEHKCGRNKGKNKQRGRILGEIGFGRRSCDAQHW